MSDKRFVQLWTWYEDRKGRRFCVVEKSGRFDANGIYRTTTVSVLEYLSNWPQQIQVDVFWQYVDQQKFIPVKPEKNGN